jgi:hypothetical protein
MCHLLRTNGRGTDFEDIHQVCPHTSSAWYIGQDLNAPQCAAPRLFKTHRELQQVAPFAKGIKYIATIRDPIPTLISVYTFKLERGEIKEDTTITDYAKSSKWTTSHNEGCISTIYDHIATFWRCCHANATGFLLLPYEDLVLERKKWLPIIAQFMDITSTSDVIAHVSDLTSKEAMLKDVAKFDESWCERQRDRIGRAHPTIKKSAPKVKVNNSKLLAETLANKEIMALNAKLWAEKVESVTGFKNYEEMRTALVQMHFP